jgi:hypothetical protein
MEVINEQSNILWEKERNGDLKSGVFMYGSPVVNPKSGPDWLITVYHEILFSSTFTYSVRCFRVLPEIGYPGWRPLVYGTFKQSLLRNKILIYIIFSYLRK